MEKKSGLTMPEQKILSKLLIVDLDEKIKVNITQKAYTKISYLLQRISEVEWSAIMFYTVKGHYTNPSEMVCKIEDIYLMDKGTGGSTSHDYDNEDVVKAFDAHPEYMDMKMGHLHSHNSMKSYFSSIDMDELVDNVVNHQYYLSLVVNNKAEMVAKLCYVGKQETKSKITVRNKVGNWIKINSSRQEEQEVMFCHDCNISISIPDAVEFVERFKEVTTKVKPVPVKTYSYPSFNKKENPPYYPRNYQDSWDEYDNYTGYRDTAKPSTPSLPPHQPNYQKQVLFAKALVSCKVSDIEDKSIYEVIREAKDTFGGIDMNTIADSYEEFYEQNIEKGGEHFILEAYTDIYKRKIEDVTIGELEIECEAAMKLLYGEIGAALTEVLDLYILSLYERSDVKGEPTEINDAIKSLADGK